MSAKRPDDLAAAVIRSLLDRSGIDSSLVEDVVLGNTNQAGEDCRNVARNVALLAGMHTSVGDDTMPQTADNLAWDFAICDSKGQSETNL